MAFYSDTHFAPTSLLDHIRVALSNYAAEAGKRAAFNQTVRELKALSDRELMDLGIHRSMITRIAYESAFGA